MYHKQQNGHRKKHSTGTLSVSPTHIRRLQLNANLHLIINIIIEKSTNTHKCKHIGDTRHIPQLTYRNASHTRHIGSGTQLLLSG